MRKILLILLAVLAAVVIAALPFLCTHSDILPEVSTAYYEYNAKKEALTATGPEAELMRMLTGLSADTKLEPVSTPVTFSWFGLVLACGAVVAILLLLWLTRKQTSLRQALLWTVALAVPFGLMGARLVYCLVNIGYYLNAISSPEAMLKMWEGGLSLAGALVFIVLAGVIGAKISRFSVGTLLYTLVPALLVFGTFVSIGVETNNMGFGPEAEHLVGSFTAMFGETRRLNTAMMVACIMVALAAAFFIHVKLLIMRGKLNPSLQFALYAFLYGSVMILMESLREDGHMVWGFVHAEMVFDLCFALPALLYLAKTKKRILLSLLATAVLAGAVVALEFALDRSSIGDGLLYAAYIAVLGGYVFLGCYCAKKRLAA